MKLKKKNPDARVPLVATVSDSTDKGHSRHCGELCGTVCEEQRSKSMASSRAPSALGSRSQVPAAPHQPRVLGPSGRIAHK